jgi:histidinol phosphatase-like enzyme (inositol monophosphatase family)
MSFPDPHPDLEFAERLAEAARAAIAPYFRAGAAIDNKLEAGFDPVTEADRASEMAMRALIEAERPEDGILGEEFGVRDSRNGRTWVLDPIDGTRAFIAGLPTWTVLIALNENGTPRLGVIDQPHVGERFIGAPEGGLYRRGGETRPLRSRSGATLETAILATTDPYLFEDEGEAAAFDAVRGASRLSRFGYDAYAYAMIAMGGVDLVMESGLQPYDVQALIPVVEAAGGVFTDWEGRPAPQGGRVLAAANPDLHAEALALIRSAL